jgi:hypothetical protein
VTDSSALTVGVTALVSISAVFITYILTRRREHKADLRKLKFDLYQEFLLAISGIVGERGTEEAHRRYADAVNSILLVGTDKVLIALQEYMAENSDLNKQRSRDKLNRLLDLLLRAMREDIHPRLSVINSTYSFRLQDVPPKAG